MTEIMAVVALVVRRFVDMVATRAIRKGGMGTVRIWLTFFGRGRLGYTLVTTQADRRWGLHGRLLLVALAAFNARCLMPLGQNRKLLWPGDF